MALGKSYCHFHTSRTYFFPGFAKPFMLSENENKSQKMKLKTCPEKKLLATNPNIEIVQA